MFLEREENPGVKKRNRKEDHFKAIEWQKFHQKRIAEGNYPKWPNETMLKILFGGYLRLPAKPETGWKVLDVGCGFGNNLLPFLDIGCECCGVEIDGNIATLCHSILTRRGYSADIQYGTNRELPYQESTFDLLLSINTLHYESSHEYVMAALAEFNRVLKPSGILYLCTVGPEHEIYRRAETLGFHQYRVSDYDFRNGQEFFFFDNEHYLEWYCGKIFKDVEVGRVTERLMSFTSDFLIAVCRKKTADYVR